MFLWPELCAFCKKPTGVAFLLGEELSNKAESDPLWAPLWLLWFVLTHYLPTLPYFSASDRLRFFPLMQLFHWDPGRRVIVRAAPGVALSDCNSIISGLAMTIIPGAHRASPKRFHKTQMYVWESVRKEKGRLSGSEAPVSRLFWSRKVVWRHSSLSLWIATFAVWVKRTPKGWEEENNTVLHLAWNTKEIQILVPSAFDRYKVLCHLYWKAILVSLFVDVLHEIG